MHTQSPLTAFPLSHSCSHHPYPKSRRFQLLRKGGNCAMSDQKDFHFVSYNADAIPGKYKPRLVRSQAARASANDRLATIARRGLPRAVSVDDIPLPNLSVSSPPLVEDEGGDSGNGREVRPTYTRANSVPNLSTGLSAPAAGWKCSLPDVLRQGKRSIDSPCWEHLSRQCSQ